MSTRPRLRKCMSGGLHGRCPCLSVVPAVSRHCRQPRGVARYRAVPGHPSKHGANMGHGRSCRCRRAVSPEPRPEARSQRTRQIRSVIAAAWMLDRSRRSRRLTRCREGTATRCTSVPSTPPGLSGRRWTPAPTWSVTRPSPMHIRTSDQLSAGLFRRPRRGRQARHPRHLDPDPTRPGHRPARTRPRRRARRPARHPRRQRSGRTPAGDASRWLVRGRGSGLVSWPRPVGAPGFGGVEHHHGRRASAGHCLRLDSVTGKVHPTRPIQAP